MTRTSLPGRPHTIESRLLEACTWWQTTGRATTCSLSGSGAVAEVERWFADHVRHRAGFGVGSGTQGLEAALRACGAGPGSRVALPAYDWSAATAATLAVGAIPIWTDVGPHGVVTARTASELSEHPDVMVATDLHGYPVDVRGIRDTLDGIPIVEDCTQALGASRWGRNAGTNADVAVWSLGHGKLIDAVEGGIVTTPDRHLAEQLLRSTQHPLRQTVSGSTPSLLAAGTRIHPAAALLAAYQLERIKDSISTQRARGLCLAQAANAADLNIQPPEDGVAPAWHRVVVLHPASEIISAIAIGEIAYPFAPPALLDHPVPVIAAQWAMTGRSLTWANKPARA